MVESLTEQLEHVLHDKTLFKSLIQQAFIKCCSSSSETHTGPTLRRVNFPQVSDIIENLLKASGATHVRFNEVHDIWRRHCDPVTSDMDEQLFSKFVRSMFRDIRETTSKKSNASKSVAAYQPLRFVLQPAASLKSDLVEEIPGTASTTSIEESPVLSTITPSRPYIPFPRAQTDWLSESFSKDLGSRPRPVPQEIELEEPLPLATFHEDIDSALSYAYALVSAILARQGRLVIQDIPGVMQHHGPSLPELSQCELVPNGEPMVLPRDFLGLSFANALAVIQTLPNFPEILFPREGWDPELRKLGVHILCIAGKYAVVPGLRAPLEDLLSVRSEEGLYLWPVLCRQALIALVGSIPLLRLSLTDDILRDLSDSLWVERTELTGEEWLGRLERNLAAEDTAVIACTSMPDENGPVLNDDQIYFITSIDSSRIGLSSPSKAPHDGPATQAALTEMDASNFGEAFDSIIAVRGTPSKIQKWSFHGRFTSDTSGGTPIPLRQTMPGTRESWARNPMFMIKFPPDSKETTEIMVTFSQLPSEDRSGGPLEELFVCLIRLDSPQQPLERFDKDRIHREGGMSRLRRGRHVAFHALEVPASGSYAVVPSTWSTSVSIEYQITIMCLSDHPCADIVPDVRPLKNFVPATRTGDV
ncbi:hypothetical protein FOL46_004153 [Perkinsus olseni]|nr:hypothetical protein FOL46_004153 [Perkinsus olseni]